MSSPKEISKRVAASKRRSRGVSDVYPPTTSDNAVLLLRRLWAPVLGVGVEESWREEEERKERLRERERKTERLWAPWEVSGWPEVVAGKGGKEKRMGGKTR